MADSDQSEHESNDGSGDESSHQGGCCGKLFHRREPLEFPKCPYISLNPCRIIELALFLGLIAMLITVIVYASFNLKYQDEIKANAMEAALKRKEQIDDMQKKADLIMAKVKNKEFQKLDIKGSLDYLKSADFKKVMFVNICLTAIMCGVSILVASKCLKCFVNVFIMVAIVTLSAVGFIVAHIMGSALDPKVRWGIPLGFCLVLVICYMLMKKAIRYALACLDSAFDFYWKSLIFTVCLVVIFLALHLLWVATCFCAYSYFKYRSQGEPANKNDMLYHVLKIEVEGKNYQIINFAILFSYFWGKTYIEYFSDVVYAGAIARKILRGERGRFLQSIYITITKLNGTISFASFNIAIVKTLKYVLEPKEPTELTIMHGIPFYFFIMGFYNKFGAKYLKCFFVALEKVCDYINCYALIVASIYGDTLCGSGMRLFQLGLLATLRNDIVVEFIIFLIIFFNACVTAMIAFALLKFGCAPLNMVPLTPEQDSILIMVTFITFVLSYFFTKVVFEPITVMSRTTYVLHEMEPDLFLHNDPDHFEEFSAHVTRHLKDLDEDEIAAKTTHTANKAAAKRAEHYARDNGVIGQDEAV